MMILDKTASLLKSYFNTKSDSEAMHAEPADAGHEDVASNGDCGNSEPHPKYEKALAHISQILPPDVRITPFDLEINVAAGSRIGGRYTLAFPLLMAARNKTVGLKIEAHVKKESINDVVDLARALEKSGSIVVEHTDYLSGKLFFRCLDTTLMNNEWVAGFCATTINHAFKGMPYTYLLFPTLATQDGQARRRFDAVFSVGQTLGALIANTHAARPEDWGRLQQNCEDFGIDPANVVVLLTPRSGAQTERTKILRHGFRVEMLQFAHQALRSIRLDEVRRHRAALKAVGAPR